MSRTYTINQTGTITFSQVPSHFLMYYLFELILTLKKGFEKEATIEKVVDIQKIK